MYTVAITKNSDPKKLLEETLSLSGGISNIIRNKNDKILIKPNLGCHKTATTGATTDLRVLASLIEVLQGEGYSSIEVGDGGMAGYLKIDILDYLGVKTLCGRYAVPTINLNDDNGIVTELANGARVKISQKALTSKVINLAKLKTHVLTTVTLGIKNLMGCVVGFDKREVHLHGLNLGLASLPLKIRPCFSIIEGLIGMQGRGPVAGEPIETNTMVASKDVVAADVVTSKIMGFDPFSIGHLRHAIRLTSKRYELEDIEVKGTPLAEAVVPFQKARPKRLEDNFWVDKLRHMIRGKPPQRLAYAISSSNALFGVLRNLGILQEELGHELFSQVPSVIQDFCVGCIRCRSVCPAKAIFIREGKAEISHDKCVKCYCCVELCPTGAIKV